MSKARFRNTTRHRLSSSVVCRLSSSVVVWRCFLVSTFFTTRHSTRTRSLPRQFRERSTCEPHVIKSGFANLKLYRCPASIWKWTGTRPAIQRATSSVSQIGAVSSSVSGRVQQGFVLFSSLAWGRRRRLHDPCSLSPVAADFFP